MLLSQEDLSYFGFSSISGSRGSKCPINLSFNLTLFSVLAFSYNEDVPFIFTLIEEFATFFKIICFNINVVSGIVWGYVGPTNKFVIFHI